MTLPLAVDLDGTLCATDTFHEGLCRLAAVRPAGFLAIPGWWRRGRARVKAGVAAITGTDAAHFPYRPDVLEWLRAEHAAGRELWLVTGADRRTARAVADHLGIFRGVIASDGRTNRVAEAKAAALTARFGAKGFAYAGDSGQDYAPWAAAGEAIVVGGRDPRVPVARRFAVPGAGARTWIKALRCHQWAKNALVFLPLLAAHAWHDPQAWLVTILAAVGLSLGASAVYLLNDLLDLPNDRRHERKRHRPLAAGRIRLPRAALASALLFAGGLAVGWAAGPAVAAVVALHAIVTTLYSFRLKRIPLVDVFVLTGLYLIRPIAGALATGLAFSPWLAAVVFFLFLSLALAKRSAELQRIRPGAAPGRGWHRRDRPVVDAFGIGTGIAATVVLSLYLFSDKVGLLYREPMWLWPVVALLLSWILRVWLKTARGRMHHDPLVFALTDGPTWGIAVAVAGCVLLATAGVRW